MFPFLLCPVFATSCVHQALKSGNVLLDFLKMQLSSRRKIELAPITLNDIVIATYRHGNYIMAACLLAYNPVKETWRFMTLTFLDFSYNFLHGCGNASLIVRNVLPAFARTFHVSNVWL